MTDDFKENAELKAEVAYYKDRVAGLQKLLDELGIEASQTRDMMNDHITRQHHEIIRLRGEIKYFTSRLGKYENVHEEA